MNDQSSERAMEKARDLYKAIDDALPHGLSIRQQSPWGPALDVIAAALREAAGPSATVPSDENIMAAALGEYLEPDGLLYRVAFEKGALWARGQAYAAGIADLAATVQEAVAEERERTSKVRALAWALARELNTISARDGAEVHNVAQSYWDTLLDAARDMCGGDLKPWPEPDMKPFLPIAAAIRNREDGNG